MPKDREIDFRQSQELSKCLDENDPVEADRLQGEALTRHRKRRKDNIERTIEELRETLTDDERYVMALASEKGASNWLAALPLQRYGFNLTKVEFKDGLALRYGWQPKNLPPVVHVESPSLSPIHYTVPKEGIPTFVTIKSVTPLQTS